MGRAKDLIVDRGQQWIAVRDIAIEAGVLTFCEHHADGIFSRGADLEGAYRLANARYTAGKMDMFSSRLEMTDAIKEVVADHSMEECSWCARRREKG